MRIKIQKSYPFLTSIRILKSQWFLSMINVLGLTIGIVCAIFIFLWVNEEKSFDKLHPESDRLYRIEFLMNFETQTLWEVSPDVLADQIKQDYSEVELSTHLKRGYKHYIAYKENNFYEDNFLYATSSFFDLFYYPGESKKDAESLLAPYTILISQSMASKYFGDESPIGKELIIKAKHHFTIAGVFPDYPSNFHLKIDFLASFETLSYTGESLGNWGRFDFLTYIRLAKGVNQNDFQEKVSNYISSYRTDSKHKLQLQLVEDIHLYSDKGAGSITKVRIITLIGFLILIIALINFMNISTSQSIRRHKEISIRKTVGATRRRLMGQVYSELGLLTTLAMGCSILLVWILLPYFNQLTGKQIAYESFFTGNLIFSLVGIILIIVFLAGLYPAFFMSSFQPIDLLSQKSTRGNGKWVRQVLVVIQFTVSVVLILSTLIINHQFRYIQKMDLGFSKENLLYIQVPRISQSKLDVLDDKFSQITGNANIAISSGILANMGTFGTINKWEGNKDEESLMANLLDIDHRFISMHKIEIVEGRDFRFNENINHLIINQEAAKKMGFDRAVGKWISRGDEIFEIVGVVKDFHFKPLNDQIAPLLLHYSKKGSYFNIKYGENNLANTVNALETATKEVVSGHPFSFGFLDDTIDKYYTNDKQAGRIISLFSIIAILISCMGILGLSVFMAQTKRREIGIRKALGASKGNIVFQTIKEILILVLVSNLIGMVIGGFILKNWLENYSYRIHPGMIDYGGVFLISEIMALATISFFAYQSASLNPIDTIREII